MRAVPSERESCTKLGLDPIATYLFSESTGIPKSTSAPEFSEESALDMSSLVGDDFWVGMTGESMIESQVLLLANGDVHGDQIAYSCKTAVKINMFIYCML